MEAGLEPPKDSGGVTLLEALDKFLIVKRQKMERDELSRRTYDEYRWQIERLLKVISRDRSINSISPADFTRLYKSFNGNPRRSRMRHAMHGRLRWIEEYNITFSYGDDFRKPSARQIRKHRNQQPLRLFEPDELRQLIDKAPPNIKGMVLLGINCGFGNEDCATLKVESLEPGWHNHPRPKTEIPRRAALWPETEEALGSRESGYVFMTKFGNPYSNRQQFKPDQPGVPRS